MKNILISLVSYAVIVLSITVCHGQNEDKVLFSVNDYPVYVDEFTYIYEKTNEEDDLYTKKSLEEYLELYTNFKLKIAEARSRGMDTVAELQNELEGYKKQLSQNYLLDKEVKEDLTRETYDRMNYDIKLAHILVRTPSSEDTAYGYRRITEAYEKLEEGSSFAEVAARLSSDTKTKNDGGMLGWRVALFPEGFSEVEEAAYGLEVGEYSKPIKSTLGYHIIKLVDKRPARGKITIAQIFLRHPENKDEEDAVKTKIDSLHELLIFGQDFGELAKTYSQDSKTKNKGGVIGTVSINTYEERFEDKIFSLAQDGQFSAPIRSELGWHIVKRLEKKDLGSYEEEKGLIQAMLQKQGRFNIAEQELMNRLKQEYNYYEPELNMREISLDLGRDMFANSWTPPTNIPERLLFSFDETDYTLIDFADYMKQNKGFRFKHGAIPNKVKALRAALDEYSKEMLLAHEETFLEEKYPDFKALMREYREGILLFEIQKQEVWDLAVEDTAVLRQFYLDNKSQYVGNKQVVLDHVTVNTDEEKVLKKIRRKLPRKSMDYMKFKFNKVGEVLTTEREVLDIQKAHDMELSTQVGSITEAEKLEGGRTAFTKVSEILPGEQKSFENSRGAVIVDYQNALEKEWIERLKEKHTLEVNHDVLMELVRS